ncbi:MAG: DNA polymerase IV [Alkalispirochaeta sp.]
MAGTLTFFHVDMDAFYASVEQRDVPELRGKPVLVGGEGKRGVVAACSYESRVYGVHSAMPMAEALRRCPTAVVVPVRMARYRELSREIMQRFSNYSPQVQAISVDEAFLEMTGTERLMGPARDIATRLKHEIHDTTGLTISVGIGTSRFIAKLASDVDKPDGLYQVFPGTEADFVLTLSLKDLWGLGARTRRRLEALGITTVEKLRQQRIEYLRGHFGDASGRFLYAIARGEDPGIYSGSRDRHSISAEETFQENIRDRGRLHRHMLQMAEEVFHRSITEGWLGKTIQVKYRFPPFETHTVSRTLPRQLAGSEELAAIAMQLLEPKRQGRPLRLLGVGVTGHAQEAPTYQGELFQSDDATPLDSTIVALRQRFGADAIGRAAFYDRNQKHPPHTEDAADSTHSE